MKHLSWHRKLVACRYICMLYQRCIKTQHSSETQNNAYVVNFMAWSFTKVIASKYFNSDTSRLFPAYQNWNISSWWARSAARACPVRAGWPSWCRAGPRRPPGDREPATHPPPHRHFSPMVTTTTRRLCQYYGARYDRI